tara:strand:+ start:25350 stop:26285 length:936 start_codon:yes stop_codon:yes gene_type:complete
MNCLKNVVGIRCQGDSSSSGLYVEDLEGINIKTAAQIADNRYQSGIDLIAKKKDFAVKAIVNDIRSQFLPYFRTNSIVDELKVGTYKDTTLTPSPFARGIQIKTRNSKLLKIRVSTIEIRLADFNYTGILDIIDGTNKTSYDFETDNEGVALIEVNYLSSENEIQVVIEDPNIKPIDAYVKKGCNCYTRRSEFLHATGYKDGDKASSTFGLSVQFLAECDNEKLICLISNQLGFPILYKTGIEIVKEWIASDRLNPVTIIDDGTEEFLLENFENEYKKQLNLLIETLPKLMNHLDDVCVVCVGNHYVEAIP